AEDGIRDFHVTGVQTCALPICQQLQSQRQSLDEEAARQATAAEALAARQATLDDKEAELQSQVSKLKETQAALDARQAALQQDQIGRASGRERGQIRGVSETVR